MSNWTPKQPTKPGWYWAKWIASGTEFVVWVFYSPATKDTLIARQVGSREVFHLSRFHSFQGPILPEQD
jgi:hypothetical protein